MKLSSVYREKINQYANENLEWVQFVKDHYKEIKANSTSVELDPIDMASGKYRLNYLLKKCKTNESLGWIVLLINQLDSSSDLHFLKSILIPDEAYIHTLSTKFITIKANKDKILDEEE